MSASRCKDPFRAPTVEGLARAITSQDATVDPRRLVPGISRDLKVVLETAMAKEPRRRYQTAGGLRRGSSAACVSGCPSWRVRHPWLTRLEGMVPRQPGAGGEPVSATFVFLLHRTRGHHHVAAGQGAGAATPGGPRPRPSWRRRCASSRGWRTSAVWMISSRSPTPICGRPIPIGLEALRSWLGGRGRPHRTASSSIGSALDVLAADHRCHGRGPLAAGEAGGARRSRCRALTRRPTAFGPTIESVRWRQKVAVRDRRQRTIDAHREAMGRDAGGVCGTP